MKILSITENGVTVIPKIEKPVLPKEFRTVWRKKGCKTCRPIEVVSVDMPPTAWPTNSA